MNVKITSTSRYCEVNVFVQVDSIEDAISQIKNDPILLKNLTKDIDPKTFVLEIPEKDKGYDYILEIYDDWRE